MKKRFNDLFLTVLRERMNQEAKLESEEIGNQRKRRKLLVQQSVRDFFVTRNAGRFIETTGVACRADVNSAAVDSGMEHAVIVRRKTHQQNSNMVYRIFDIIKARFNNTVIKHVADLNCGEGGMSRRISREAGVEVTKFDKFKNCEMKGRNSTKYTDTLPLDDSTLSRHMKRFHLALWDVPYTVQHAGHTLLNVSSVKGAVRQFGFLDRYGVDFTYSNDNLMKMFAEGFVVGRKILVAGGFLFVKCTDTRTRCHTIEIVRMGTTCFNYSHFGTFILAPAGDLIDVNGKTCSIMLVFKLTKAAERIRLNSIAAAGTGGNKHSPEDAVERVCRKVIETVEKSDSDYQKVAVEKEAKFRSLLRAHTVLLGWLATKYETAEDFQKDAIENLGETCFGSGGFHLSEAVLKFDKLRKNFEELKRMQSEKKHCFGARLLFGEE